MRLESGRWGLLGLGLFTYGVYYLGRVNLAVATPLLQSERGLSAGDIGLLAVAFFWVYAVGGVAVGIAADRFGSGLLVAGGLVGSAAANLVFGLSDLWLAMLAAWTFNGAFQAMGWSPLVGGLNKWVPAERAESAAMVLGASFVVGSTLGLGVGSALVEWGGIEGAFIGPCVAMAGMGVIWWRVDSAERDRARPHRGLSDVVWSLTGTVRLWPVVGLVGLVYVAIVIWLPLYLVDVHGLTAGRAGSIAAVLIGVGVVGPVVAGRWLDENSTRRRRHAAILATASVCLGVVVVGNLALAVVWVPLAAGGLLVAASASVVLGGFAFSSPGSGVATVSGVLALVFNLGGGLGSVLIGRLVDRSDWDGVFALLAAALAGGAVLEVTPGVFGRHTRPVS